MGKDCQEKSTSELWGALGTTFQMFHKRKYLISHYLHVLICKADTLKTETDTDLQ